jgi:hypothetical protein
MNAWNDALLVLVRGGMEISWRYAWAFFLTQLAIQRHFPLPAAVGAFCTAAFLTFLSVGRNWRAYQRLLLQIAGFVMFALLAAHPIQYQASPFFSLRWIGKLFLDAKSLSQWSVLILTLFCLWLIWRGGQILVKTSRLYFPVCMHFDKGLGLFFLLLIIKAFVESRAGLYVQGRTIGFLAIAYFIFSLTSISMARNQNDVQKSFLSGYQGIGVILSVSAMVVLMGAGTAFLIYPYLFGIADSMLVVLKDAAQPMTSVLVKILLFLFRPRKISLQPDEPYNDAPTLPDLDNQTVMGWEAILQNVIGAVLIGIIGIVILGILSYFLICVIRWLLKRSQDGAPSLSTEGISDLLKALLRLPIIIWHELVSLLKGVDCAKTAYFKMLQWGRRSGKAQLASETPTEYGNRLTKYFPDLESEITMVVEAFNREVYGQTTVDRKILSRLRFAHRCMKRPRYWPSRIKVRYFQ